MANNEYVEKLVDDNSHDELWDIVQEEDVEGVKETDNKTTLAAAIAENRHGPLAEEDEGDEADEEEVVDSEPAQEPELDPNDEDAEVVRFIGKNASFRTGGQTFTSKEPFAVMTVEGADHVFKQWSNKFRPASKTEIKEFYGLN